MEVLDAMIGEIDRRFNQESLKAPLGIEKMIVSAANGDCDIPSIVRDMYSDDIDERRLLNQLNLLHDFVTTADSKVKEVKHLRTVAEAFRKQPIGRGLLSEVEKILRIYLTTPITTATAERSFSAFRRLKNYLRATMTQKRLNNLLLLHIHKQETSDLSMKHIAQEFVNNERRRNFFGNQSDA